MSLRDDLLTAIERRTVALHEQFLDSREEAAECDWACFEGCLGGHADMDDSPEAFAAWLVMEHPTHAALLLHA